MTPIPIGSKIPEATFKTLKPTGVESISSEQLFSGRCVLIVGVIGAFTPVCTGRHLPEFIPYARELRENWLVDEVCCISASDPFSLKAWAKQLEIENSLLMLSDPNAKFAEACGLMTEMDELGLGRRNTRYVMLVHNSEVKMLRAEEQPSDLKVTSVNSVRSLLTPHFTKE